MAFIRVLSRGGPLPIVASMPVTKGKQVLFVAGSTWYREGAGYLGFEVLVDADVVGTCQVYANQSGNHMACVPTFIPLTLSPGSSPYALTLRPLNEWSLSDGNDPFQVMLFEED